MALTMKYGQKYMQEGNGGAALSPVATHLFYCITKLLWLLFVVIHYLAKKGIINVIS